MKKLLLITGFLLLNLTITVFGAENDIVASTSPFKVQINENSCIDNKTYPSLFYNNVVYIPMTYNVGESVGRTIEWVDGYEQDVLLLTEKESENIIEKNALSENEIKPQAVSVEIADCTVAVCVGENLNLIRGTEEYPLLRYKDIIYIPLTWENIVGNFGWSYTFDEINGVNIDASKRNVEARAEKDIFISEDGSTTSYILNKRKYSVNLTDDYDEEKTDYIGVMRFNHDMTAKVLQDRFIIERELARPVRQGDVRVFKTYGWTDEFYSPKTEDLWTFLHAATTMMLDTRTGSINKWQTLASWRKKEVKDESASDTFLSMSGTDYVSDGVTIINIEPSDIELKAIPMQYVIKRVDEGRNEIILTYDVPTFSGGSIVVPAPTSTITKLQFSLPPWDFRDANGNYVPEGEYEISLIVPDKVEYVVNGETVFIENPKGVFTNSKIKLVK